MLIAVTISDEVNMVLARFLIPCSMFQRNRQNPEQAYLSPLGEPVSRTHAHRCDHLAESVACVTRRLQVPVP